jgi:hypothetical protein
MSQVFAPILTVIGGLFEIWSEAMQVASAIFKAVVATISDFVSALLPDTGGVKDAMTQLRDGFREVAKFALLAAVSMANFIGATKFKDNLVKQLGGPKKQDDTGFGAAKNAKTQDFASIGRDIALASAVASGTAGEDKKEVDFLKDMAAYLKDLEAVDIDAILQAKVEWLAAALIGGLKGATYNAALDSANSLADTVTFGIAGRVGRAFGFG